MAKCKLLMQTGQVQKIIDFFDGYSDDKVSCKYVKKVGIKAEFECETSQFNQMGSLDKIKMIRADKSLFFSSQKITLCI